MIAKSEMEKELLEVLGKEISKSGYNIVDLDCGPGKLTVFVQKEETGKASVEDCATVSRLIDPILEEGRWFKGPFQVEVSSPGLERRLVSFEDFKRYQGAWIQLKLVRRHEQMGSNVRVLLLEVLEEGVQVQHEKTKSWMGWSDIRKAHLIWDFEKDAPAGMDVPMTAVRH